MPLSDETKEKILKVTDVAKTVVHYGFIPFVIYLAVVLRLHYRTKMKFFGMEIGFKDRGHRRRGLDSQAHRSSQSESEKAPRADKMLQNTTQRRMEQWNEIVGPAPSPVAHTHVMGRRERFEDRNENSFHAFSQYLPSATATAPNGSSGMMATAIGVVGVAMPPGSPSSPVSSSSFSGGGAGGHATMSHSDNGNSGGDHVDNDADMRDDEQQGSVDVLGGIGGGGRAPLVAPVPSRYSMGLGGGSTLSRVADRDFDDLSGSSSIPLESSSSQRASSDSDAGSAGGGIAGAAGGSLLSYRRTSTSSAAGSGGVYHHRRRTSTSGLHHIQFVNHRRPSASSSSPGAAGYHHTHDEDQDMDYEMDSNVATPSTESASLSETELVEQEAKRRRYERDHARRQLDDEDEGDEEGDEEDMEEMEEEEEDDDEYEGDDGEENNEEEEGDVEAVEGHHHPQPQPNPTPSIMAKVPAVAHHHRPPAIFINYNAAFTSSGPDPWNLRPSVESLDDDDDDDDDDNDDEEYVCGLEGSDWCDLENLDADMDETGEDGDAGEKGSEILSVEDSEYPDSASLTKHDRHRQQYYRKRSIGEVESTSSSGSGSGSNSSIGRSRMQHRDRRRRTTRPQLSPSLSSNAATLSIVDCVADQANSSLAWSCLPSVKDGIEPARQTQQQQQYQPNQQQSQQFNTKVRYDDAFLQQQQQQQQQRLGEEEDYPNLRARRPTRHAADISIKSSACQEESSGTSAAANTSPHPFTLAPIVSASCEGPLPPAARKIAVRRTESEPKSKYCDDAPNVCDARQPAGDASDFGYGHILAYAAKAMHLCPFVFSLLRTFAIFILVIMFIIVIFVNPLFFFRYRTQAGVCFSHQPRGWSYAYSKSVSWYAIDGDFHANQREVVRVLSFNANVVSHDAQYGNLLGLSAPSIALSIALSIAHTCTDLRYETAATVPTISQPDITTFSQNSTVVATVVTFNTTAASLASIAISITTKATAASHATPDPDPHCPHLTLLEKALKEPIEY
ncbi:hypothetical protein DFQ27_006834 [Actinomortierella ambigua]|uniref:Uncharacterized protein n=1 Tax=Actinomortierella ambigua TaxID=1343610 RepID=A0A9P6PXW9_9FUNG|nr:hypothetical protein DFQ27_006834 [Actinomortierella ambigua]